MCCIFIQVWLWGSSPRMRGKRQFACLNIITEGLIPAHAGKTKSPSTQSVKGRAHPRACGENVAWCGIHARARAHPRACGENHRRTARNGIAGGSSPRMRGKRRHSEQRRIPRRLIPAHAGKTLACDRGRSTRRAHPRACGENELILGNVSCPVGSSPRMRGKRGYSQSALARAMAHPRACGENLARPGHVSRKSGSSPRMRGKRNDHAAASTTRRLIPAHAGKTTRAKLVAFHAAAHPRACGENITLRSISSVVFGSSPRMRGKLQGRRKRGAATGLIPAHAGKTVFAARTAAEAAAHPRACGENFQRLIACP